jgi:hypothetical protein
MLKFASPLNHRHSHSVIFAIFIKIKYFPFLCLYSNLLYVESPNFDVYYTFWYNPFFLVDVSIVPVYVSVSSILFLCPQCIRYFWRVFRFLFLERKQDSKRHLSKMFKVAFKDVNTKNSEPTYWTILFVMLKIYLIYKVAGKRSRKAI